MRLLDIEGTVCPVSFVHKVLFPYARARIATFVEAHHAEPEVARALVAAASEAGVAPADRAAVVRALLTWIDSDRKVTALKTLQGLIWRQGYAEGAFRAPLYDDVVPALDRWRAADEPVAVFSSGSVAAQRLFFGHTEQGDLVARFSAFFDTEIGSKLGSEAYYRIADRCGVPPATVRFYSDVVAELDAAAEAGMQTVWVVRQGALTPAKHAAVTDLRGA